MSKYTTQVRFICESKSGLAKSKGCDSVDEVIANSWDKIFTTKAPFFDESYRSVLCQKILKHYYLREIGAETVGVWKLWLNTRLEEIMPYYNQLYKSELLEFNPLYDVDITRKHERTGNETSSGSGTSNSSSEAKNTSASTRTQNDSSSDDRTDKYSDTPQGSISDLSDDTYLTNARIISDKSTGTLSENTSENGTSTGVVTGNTTTNGIVDTTENYLERVSGKQGGESYSSLLNKYRETFLNIDMKVIDEFSDLFFGLW